MSWSAPSAAQQSLGSDQQSVASEARPYPFGVFRLDTLNSLGPDSRGWNYLPPPNSYTGPAQANPSRQRYGLPPLNQSQGSTQPLSVLTLGSGDQ